VKREQGYPVVRRTRCRAVVRPAGLWSCSSCNREPVLQHAIRCGSRASSMWVPCRRAGRPGGAPRDAANDLSGAGASHPVISSGAGQACCGGLSALPEGTGDRGAAVVEERGSSFDLSTGPPSARSCCACRRREHVCSYAASHHLGWLVAAVLFRTSASSTRLLAAGGGAAAGAGDSVCRLRCAAQPAQAGVVRAARLLARKARGISELQLPTDALARAATYAGARETLSLSRNCRGLET